MSMTAVQFNGAMNFARTAIVVAVGARYGTIASGIVGTLIGHPAMMTQLAAMGEKNEAGQLEGSDVAGLIKIVADIAIGAALAGGATVAVPVAAIWAMTGVALAIYSNRETIQSVVDHMNDRMRDGYTKIENAIRDIYGFPRVSPDTKASRKNNMIKFFSALA